MDHHREDIQGVGKPFVKLGWSVGVGAGGKWRALMDCSKLGKSALDGSLRNGGAKGGYVDSLGYNGFGSRGCLTAIVAHFHIFLIVKLGLGRVRRGGLGSRRWRRSTMAFPRERIIVAAAVRAVGGEVGQQPEMGSVSCCLVSRDSQREIRRYYEDTEEKRRWKSLQEI